jgi:hypothetical protein
MKMVRRLTLKTANFQATIASPRFARLPFIEDHFNKRKLVGHYLLAVVYTVRITAGHAVKIAPDINRSLILIDPRHARWASLDARITCAAASSALAADLKLSGFPEAKLNSGFHGRSVVVFSAPLELGAYRLAFAGGKQAVRLGRPLPPA